MSELVKSISIANLLNQVAAIQERFIAGKKSLQEAEDICKNANLGSVSRILSHHGICNEDFVAKAMKELEGNAWHLLMKESGLMTFMSAKRREEWNKTIEKQEFPELTRDTIAATFRNIHADRETMFESGVIECFRRLSWDYKTNLPCKFGKKIIVTYLISSYGSANYKVCNEIDDLMRIFCVLDGKPEPDHRYGIYYQMSGHSEESSLSNTYISLRWFKKGTGHITFKRLDLVAALNGILAKHHPNALPSRV